jgi:dolichol-phosphate mannosyltransferase
MTDDRVARRTLCLVVPCFNEAANLAALVQATSAALSNTGVDWRWLFVNDGSSDETLAVLSTLRAQDARIRWITLARNFGLQSALAAGLRHADGDATVVMDADGQDEPRAIATFVERWHDGADVVYAVRSSRPDPLLRRTAIRGFHWLMARLSDVPIPQDAGSFALYDRRVVRWINQLPERGRYLPGLRAWVGLRQDPVPVARNARLDNAPRQSFARLIGLALDGLLSFSKKPLHLAAILGFVVTALATLAMMVVLYWRFVSRSFPANVGQATIALALLFLSGVQLLVLGILGEYLGRVFDEAKHRPMYFVASVEGLEHAEDEER